MSSLARRSTAWMDRHFDAERGLLWNPPRSFSDDLPAHCLHIVPQNSWYVLGLLDRRADGDVERAEQIIGELAALQYDEPGTPWHGSYARFAETPAPVAGAVEFEDYDPNWRQFIGTALTVALRAHGDVLSSAARAAVEATVERATVTEPPERVAAYYSNIALKRAWLDVEWGDAARGHQLAEEVVDLFDRSGQFHEFNSPTYYGIDLWGLALWRGHSSSPRLRAWGERLEAALWRSAAAFYHAGLRNLAAPYTRAYGLDMESYVAQLGLWVWEGIGEEHAPLPAFDTASDPDPDTAGGDDDDGFSHSHDVCFGPCPAAVGVAVPDDAAEAFRRFTGERVVQVPISTGRNGRTASAWLATDARGDVMLGGESGGWDFGDWDQFVAGAVHWRDPDGAVRALRVRQPGRPAIAAEPARLVIDGPSRVLFDGVELDAGVHDLPGRPIRIDRPSSDRTEVIVP